MRRGQVSIEFIMLFGLAILAFVVTASLIPGLIRDSSGDAFEAERHLKEIKVNVITASVASNDYRAELDVPSQINGNPVTLDIRADTKTISFLRDDASVLASEDLPSFDIHNTGGPAGKLVIEKTGGQLELQTP